MQSSLTRLPLGWIVGRTQAMDVAIVALNQAVRTVEHWGTLGDALAAEVTAAPDLVLVCQHWSDEYRTDEVEQLLATCPLARVICCYGPWCASDGRTRNVWPLALRVPVEQAAMRIEAERLVALGLRAPLPCTATVEEIFAFDAESWVASSATH
ncbi:MAG: hypothetical protein KDA58_05530 [Planctomycetaceae bacterium]|nr:hypothetical protein [Planctomycetaceae bacterium]